MKTIGLLGGMSWESTAGYYRAINEGVKNALGGLHSAKIILYSVDFAPIEKLQCDGDWDGTAGLLSDAARRVQASVVDARARRRRRQLRGPPKSVHRNRVKAHGKTGRSQSHRRRSRRPTRKLCSPI